MPERKKPGPPRTEFGPEQIDRAKRLLGRYVYVSRVAELLEKKYGFSPTLAYRLIDAAREDVIRGVQATGTAADPLTAVLLYYLNTMATAAEQRDRNVAANGLVKLLGMDRIIKQMDAGGVEAFLAGVLGRAGGRPPVPEVGGAAH